MSAHRAYSRGLQFGSVFLGAFALLAIALSKFISSRLYLIVVAAAVVGFIATLVFLALAVPRSLPRGLGRVALSVVGALALGYALLFIVVYLGQDALANESNAFFQPRVLTEVAAAQFEAPGVEPLAIPTSDGEILRGWLVRGSAEAKQPLVIYFGGSGSESSAVLDHARLLAPWSVALVNYRGFGQSTGKPTPAHALSDALLVYDTLTTRPDVDASRISVIGYSLGTGVAVQVAGQRPVSGVVLFAPYESLKLAQPGASPIYAPLQPIMKTYFSPAETAPRIRAPLLTLVGSDDTVFPPEVSRRLAAAWGGPSSVKIYEGEGHTLSERDDGSWLDVRTFLGTLSPNNERLGGESS